MTRRHAQGARGLVLLLVSLHLVLAFGALLLWGTAWRVPRAKEAGGGYSLSANWDGAALPSGRFRRPIGIAVAASGDVYVTDARKRVVRLGQSGNFKGEWGREGTGLGEFANPVGIAVAPDGSVLVSDYDQDRIQKFTADGQFLAEFGAQGSGPGQFNAPADLAIDASGSLYVADFYNHRVQKLRADGSFEKLIGRPGRIGSGALHYPTGVTVTPKGDILVADAYNYQLQWFDRKGRPSGRVGYHLFWLWPRPTSSRSGFNVPTDPAVGKDGLIHVADSGNHRVVMLSQKGEYLTEWTIPGADPRIYSPEQIAVSPDDQTVYATDLASNRVTVLRVTSTRSRQ